MYGIDFGTSNTVVSDKDASGNIQLLNIGSNSSVVPSLLYMDKSGKMSVGESAITDYTTALESWSLEDRPYEYFRFFQALKLALKDKSFLASNIFERTWTIEQLVGILLTDIKDRADKLTGKNEQSVVIGRPVSLSDDLQTDKYLENRLKEAAFFAGFTDVHFVYEPVAATVSTGAKDGEKILVFDFGGGTLDISIAEFVSGKARVIVSVGTDLGGYTLSERISEARIVGHFGSGSTITTLDGKCLRIPHNLTKQVSSFYALPLSNISETRKTIQGLLSNSNDKEKLQGLDKFLSRNMSYQLFHEIDDAKIQLSGLEISNISFKVDKYIDFREALKRSDFEEIIEDEVAVASRLIKKALHNSGLDTAEIDHVVRVGGSSQIPIYIDLLESFFPGKVTEGDVYGSISAGLITAYDQGLGTG